MASVQEPARLGARERQKLETRKALLAAAKKRFEEHGYEVATVADIAADAGVSAKTLFQHFRSKEELLLAELEVIEDSMIGAVRDRDQSRPLLETLSQWVFDWDKSGPSDGLDRFLRMVGPGPGVVAVRRRHYDQWENRLVAVLADEANEARASPRTRLIAAISIAMIKVLSSPEVRDSINRHPPDKRRAAHDAWMREAAALVGDGLNRII